MHSAEKAKNNRNITVCSNSTHQDAPHTGKRMRAYASDLGGANDVTCIRNYFVQSVDFSNSVTLLRCN